MTKGNSGTKPTTDVTPLADDFPVFVPGETKIKTLDGSEIVVPKISWKKEKQVLAELNELLAVIATSGIFTGKEPGDESIADILAFMLKHAPDKMTRATCILLDQEEDWVDNNLDSEGILGLLLPFWRSKQQSITAVIAKHLKAALAAQM